MSGEVVHFEIPADDLERAKAFYESAFGWRMAIPPGMAYVLVGTTPTNETGAPAEPGAINGGMLKRQEPIHSPVITIRVDDIDATLVTVVSLGGDVVRGKMPVGTMGFAAYGRDSEGNVFGLWEDVRK